MEFLTSCNLWHCHTFHHTSISHFVNSKLGWKKCCMTNTIVNPCALKLSKKYFKILLNIITHILRMFNNVFPIIDCDLLLISIQSTTTYSMLLWFITMERTSPRSKGKSYLLPSSIQVFFFFFLVNFSIWLFLSILLCCSCMWQNYSKQTLLFTSITKYNSFIFIIINTSLFQIQCIRRFLNLRFN